MEEVTFRKAVREDVPLILEFIKGLAEYEKMSDEVVATEEILDEWLFDKEKAEVIFAIAEGEEVGSVSYTHLDVYKRQPLEGQRPDWRRDMRILLR